MSIIERMMIHRSRMWKEWWKSRTISREEMEQWDRERMRIIKKMIEEREKIEEGFWQ